MYTFLLRNMNSEAHVLFELHSLPRVLFRSWTILKPGSSGEPFPVRNGNHLMTDLLAAALRAITCCSKSITIVMEYSQGFKNSGHSSVLGLNSAQQFPGDIT